jgi:hypothetical protein
VVAATGAAADCSAAGCAALVSSSAICAATAADEVVGATLVAADGVCGSALLGVGFADPWAIVAVPSGAAAETGLWEVSAVTSTAAVTVRIATAPTTLPWVTRREAVAAWLGMEGLRGVSWS